MKQFILLILVTFATTNLAYAQEPQKVKYKNPFEQLGYKNIKVATLSKGKYQEFHDLDSIVQIGSTLVNVNSRKIVGFVTHDTTKQSQNASVPSRWMSIDPLAHEFYSYNPYNFCLNNPLKFIDPDGRKAIENQPNENNAEKDKEPQTKPNDVIILTFPNMKIDIGNGTKISGLGHAGVLLIDNKTGLTKYYEYGRYESNKGEVRHYSVSDVVIGKDGLPTPESLSKVMTEISTISGQGGDVQGAYVKNEDFNGMNNYAQEKLQDNSNPDRKSYSWYPPMNHCGTFSWKVADSANDTSIPQSAQDAWTPITMMQALQRTYPNMEYDAKTQKAKIK
jgi:hypothetical protein